MYRRWRFCPVLGVFTTMLLSSSASVGLSAIGCAEYDAAIAVGVWGWSSYFPTGNRCSRGQSGVLIVMPASASAFGGFLVYWVRCCRCRRRLEVFGCADRNAGVCVSLEVYWCAEYNAAVVICFFLLDKLSITPSSAFEDSVQSQMITQLERFANHPLL